MFQIELSLKKKNIQTFKNQIIFLLQTKKKPPQLDPLH